MHAARERVRVANALPDLPEMNKRFQRGELSYSKVRAMTRIADETNEDYLLMIAHHGTAHHVEKLVSLYSRCKCLQDTQNTNEQYEAREVNCYYDENGSMIIKARLPAEQGALVRKALEMAMEFAQSSTDVPAGTSRRIACDCSRIAIIETETGEPLSIGRKSRSIPPAIRRALRVRDRGCRFPGCTSTHFIDGHHIKHWADGGETSLDNLVQLCRKHHRLVHEGGFGCQRLDDGYLVFKDQRGKVLAESFNLTPITTDRTPIESIQVLLPDLEIDAQTCIPMTRAGEYMDWDLAVGHLFV